MERVKIYRNVVKLNNIEMFYLDTKIKASVIVCLNGMYGRGETWDEFINYYGKEYRIIAPDQRGHGLSSKPLSKYTAEEMASDIIGLLEYLKIDSVIIVGHSMGGAVAAHVAALYPKYVKALAILDKSAEETNILPLNEEPRDPLTKDWPMPFMTLNEAKYLIKQASESDLEYEYFMKSLVETQEGYETKFSPKAIALIYAHKNNWLNILPKIKCLTMLIRASSHEAVPDEAFEKMQSMLSYCIAFEMSHPDHNVHLANKEEFYGYFDEFLINIIFFTIVL